MGWGSPERLPSLFAEGREEEGLGVTGLVGGYADCGNLKVLTLQQVTFIPDWNN